MKAIRASHSFYENSTLEETEFALAISPRPQIEDSQDIGEGVEVARERSGLDHRGRVPGPRLTAFQEPDLTETLTVGWAIALAIAVALTVYVSGG